MGRGRGAEEQRIIIFSMEKEIKIINGRSGFFVNRKIVSEANRVESVSNRESYIVSRGRWCNIIVLNVHAQVRRKGMIQNSFYEELEQVFDHFPKYNMKILSGDFNAKVGRKNIFKPTIGNESLHQGSIDNGVRIVNFATSKNLVLEEHNVPAPSHS